MNPTTTVHSEHTVDEINQRSLRRTEANVAFYASGHDRHDVHDCRCSVFPKTKWNGKSGSLVI